MQLYSNHNYTTFPYQGSTLLESHLFYCHHGYHSYCYHENHHLPIPYHSQPKTPTISYQILNHCQDINIAYILPSLQLLLVMPNTFLVMLFYHHCYYDTVPTVTISLPSLYEIKHSNNLPLYLPQTFLHIWYNNHYIIILYSLYKEHIFILNILQVGHSLLYIFYQLLVTRF